MDGDSDDDDDYAAAPAPSPAPMAMPPPQAPWPAPGAVTRYENVYCGDLEGQLQVGDDGVLFLPYIPSQVPAHNVTPHDIPWKETTYREFFQQDVQAGTQTYRTVITFYNLKIGVYPSKESIFSTTQSDEYQRLQSDLTARGYGAPVDYPDDVEYEEDDIDLGWSTEDATPTTAPESAYYPVNCKGEIGRLVLTESQLQFVPDRHSAPVKSIPWRALAADPFFAPPNYPRAQVAIHYHTTRGSNKKLGFELDSHRELLRLRDDMTDRLIPHKDAPRESVFLPPKKPPEPEPQPPPEPSVSKPQGGGGSVRKPKPTFPKNKKPKVDACDISHTEDTSSFGGNEAFITPASGVPLLRATARRVPYHQEESQRRLFLLFAAYCCIATLAGLSFSIIFGYFFGPRRPREQYIRTASPYDIQMDYLGTQKPTLTPTAVRKQWKSEAVTLTKETPETDLIKPTEDILSMAPTTIVRSTSAPSTSAPSSAAPSTSFPSAAPTVAATTGAPSLSPTTTATMRETRTSKSIVELLSESSFDGGQALRTPGTPQQAAYLLIKVSGVLDNAPSDEMIVQKYAMSTLFYATGGSDWTEGSEGWKDLVGSDCIKLHLVCDEATQTLVGIDMPTNNLIGIIPPEIGLLDTLTQINLKDNALHGTIPTQLGLLPNLQLLDLSGNPNLEGPVPTEVTSLPLLTQLKTDIP